MDCKLKVIFAERRIKQKEFAHKINISQAALSSLVNNKALPTLPVAYRIAKELGLLVEDIWKDG